MSKPVFMIGWEFPPHNSGGLGVACHGLTRALLEQGEQIVFTLPKTLAGGGTVRRERFAHAPHLAMDMVFINSTLEPYLQRTRDGNTRLEQRFYADIVQEAQEYGNHVAKIAEEYNHDVIHAHDWMSVPAGIKAREKTKKPLILHVHSTEYDRSGAGTPHQAIADIEYQGMNAADQVVTVSNYTKQILHDVYSIPNDKIEVVHNGIDPNPEFHSQTLEAFLHLRPVIVFVGRLTIQKGPEYFLSVARKVIDQEPRAVFILAGHGDMYQSLLVSAASQGLSGSVLFAGFLRGKEKAQLFRRADVFIMPSVSEPFGISALEAALEETPVIVSKTSGAQEVLPHAFPIDFWDVDLMRDTIVDLIQDPVMARQHAQTVRQEAQARTWDDAALRVGQVYNKVRGL